MIEKREISEKDYAMLSEYGSNYYREVQNFASKIAESTTWPPNKYGIYGAEIIAEEGKYYVTWAHKASKDSISAYEKEIYND